MAEFPGEHRGEEALPLPIAILHESSRLLRLESGFIGIVCTFQSDACVAARFRKGFRLIGPCGHRDRYRGGESYSSGELCDGSEHDYQALLVVVKGTLLTMRGRAIPLVVWRTIRPV
jgi:hypothetical protein